MTAVVQEPTGGLSTGSTGGVAESTETDGVTAALSETTDTVGTLTETAAPVREAAAGTIGGTTDAGEVTTTVTQKTDPAVGALAPVVGTVGQAVESSSATVTGTVEEVASAGSTGEFLAAVETAAHDVVTSTESIVGLEAGSLTGVVDGVTEPLLGSASALVGQQPELLSGVVSDTTGQILPLLGAGGGPVGASAGDSPSAGRPPGATTPWTGVAAAAGDVIRLAPAQVSAPLLAKPSGSAAAPALPPLPRSSMPVAAHLATSLAHGGATETPSAGRAEPRRDAPRPSPGRDLPAAPTPGAGTGSTLLIVFAVLAGLALLADPRLGRRLLSLSALAPPMAFASPLERPG